MIFYNGRIFTANPDQETADMMVIEDGLITWVGIQSDFPNSAETIMDKPSHEMIDLKGRRVLPGFIDIHMHASYLARDTKKIACLPPKITSIEDLQNKVREKKNKLPAGEWIEGWGYDEGKLAERRAPTRQDLDQAAPDHPVVIGRTCNHIAAANTKAMELLGFDQADYPSGIFKEDDKLELYSRMPGKTLENDARLLADSSQHLFAHGITTISESLAERHPRDNYEMYEKAVEMGLQQRALLYYSWANLKANKTGDKVKKIAASHKNSAGQLQLGGVKILADGSVSGQTAWVNHPYLGSEDNYGLQTTSQEDLLEAAEFARENDIQLIVHAMGGRAIDFVLTTLAELDNWLEERPSIRVEHAAMPSSKALEQAARNGIAFVSQPIFLFAEIESYLNNLGAERTRTTYPFRSILAAGVNLAFSSDAPATAWAKPADPFTALKSAVSRQAYDGTDTGQAERIDLATAIRLYTKKAANIAGIPGVGSLQSGCKADFIVLDRDIFSLASEQYDEVNVSATYLNGELVYQN
ncbi:MAG: amidohydrolase [Bacillota bacterium]